MTYLNCSTNGGFFPSMARTSVLIVALVGAMIAGSWNMAWGQSAKEVTATGADAGADTGKELQLVNSSGAMVNSEATKAANATVADAASHRGAMLVASLTVFALAIFVGFEIITKVPPTLHTPLMSGSNAISGITIVGAILVAGHATGGFGSFLGFIAVILAAINVVGGFLVTHRMLMMFKKR